MKPSIGRIVHFRRAGDQLPSAALVTYASWGGPLDGAQSDDAKYWRVDLHVFTRTGTELVHAVRHAEDENVHRNAEGWWDWPPREGARS
jgi:hypothetical protein